MPGIVRNYVDPRATPSDMSNMGAMLFSRMQKQPVVGYSPSRGPRTLVNSSTGMDRPDASAQTGPWGQNLELQQPEPKRAPTTSTSESGTGTETPTGTATPSSTATSVGGPVQYPVVEESPVGSSESDPQSAQEMADRELVQGDTQLTGPAPSEAASPGYESAAESAHPSPVAENAQVAPLTRRQRRAPQRFGDFATEEEITNAVGWSPSTAPSSGTSDASFDPQEGSSSMFRNAPQTAAGYSGGSYSGTAPAGRYNPPAGANFAGSIQQQQERFLQMEPTLVQRIVEEMGADRTEATLQDTVMSVITGTGLTLIAQYAAPVLMGAVRQYLEAGAAGKIGGS